MQTMNAVDRAEYELETARTLEDVHVVVRSAARRCVNADGGTFVLRDNEQCFYVDEDAMGPLWKGQRFPLSACISGWAMLHCEQVVIPNISLDERIPQEAYRPTFVASLVMTPIVVGEPVGAIGAYWSWTHEASSDELALLTRLADVTADAMRSVGFGS